MDKVLFSADAQTKGSMRSMAADDLHMYPGKKTARPGSQCSRKQAQKFQAGLCIGTATNGGKLSYNLLHICSFKYATVR